MITDDLIGVRETARRLGVHENTVRNMAGDGRLRVAATTPRTGYKRFDAHEIERVRRQMEGEYAPEPDSTPVSRTPVSDPWVIALARDLQDTLARFAPSFGASAPGWDGLGQSTEGQWARWLTESVVSDLVRRGAITRASRDVLAHLAADWTAQAAQIERGLVNPGLRMRVTVLGECAAALRDLIGIPQDQVPR